MTHRVWIAAAGMVLAATLGFAAGIGWREDPPPPNAPAPAPPRQVQQPPLPTVGKASCQVDVQQLREEVRAVLREELDAALARAGHSAQASRAQDPAPHVDAPTPKSLEALARGERLVEEGLASRHWSQKQAEELRELMGQLSDEQRRQLVQKLLPAINRGEVTVDYIGMPF